VGSISEDGGHLTMRKTFVESLPMNFFRYPPGMSHRRRIESYESTFRMEESFYVSIDSNEITNGEFLATVDECSIVYQTKSVPILRRGCSLYPIIQLLDVNEKSVEIKLVPAKCHGSAKNIFQDANFRCIPKFCQGESCKPKCSENEIQKIIKASEKLCD